MSPPRIKELWNAASKKHAETGDSSCRGHNSHAILPWIFPSSFSSSSSSSFFFFCCVLSRSLFSFFSLLSSSFYLSTSTSPFHLPRLRHQAPTTSSRRSRPQIDHGYEGAATGIKRDPREAAAGTGEKPRMSDDAQRVLDRSLDQIDGALLRRAQSDIEIAVIFDRKLDCRAFFYPRVHT